MKELYKRPSVLDINNLLNNSTQASHSDSIKKEVHQIIDQVNQENNNNEEKTKRKRANAKQLQVLNRVFDRTYFPSTQMRAELGRQLGMSPRTVQIWFQNKRQAIRAIDKK